MIYELNNTLSELSGGRHAVALKDFLTDTGEYVIPKEGLRGILKSVMKHASFFEMPRGMDERVVFEVLNHAWQGPLPADISSDRNQTGRDITGVN